MKLFSSIAIASIASALISLTACSDKNAAEKALKDTTQGVENAVNSIDWSKLSPEALKSKATEVTNEVRTELDKVKDSDGAKKMVANYQAVVDELAKAKDKIKAQNVDMSALKKSIDDTATRLSQETKDALRPVIDKLKTLTH